MRRSARANASGFVSFSLALRLAGRLRARDKLASVFGANRNGAIFRGGVAGGLAKGLSAVTQLVTVPLAVRALGRSQFGVYLTIATVLGLLQILNFGVANGLVTQIAHARAIDDTRKLQTMVSSAYVVIGLVGSAGLIFAGLVSPRVPWALLLGSSATPGKSVDISVSVAIALTMLSLLTSIGGSVRLGLQQSATAALWNGFGGLLQMFAVGTAYLMHADLVGFVVALTVAPIFSGLGNTLSLFRAYPWSIPRFSHATTDSTLRLLKGGAAFSALAVAGALAFQTDTLVLSHVDGPSAVAEYGVAYRLFTLAPMLTAFFVTPLWPAIGDAVKRGEGEWVVRAYSKVLRGSLVVNGTFGVILLVLARPIAGAWVGRALEPSWLLASALALYVLVLSASSPLAMLLNGIGDLSWQVKSATIMAITNIFASILFSESLGVSGPIWGTVVAQTGCTLLPGRLHVRKIARTLKRIETSSSPDEPWNIDRGLGGG